MVSYKERYKDLLESNVRHEKATKNVIAFSVISAIIFNILNNKTNIPLSIEDGLSFNLYLLPMLTVAIFYIVYGILYCNHKVKGRLYII